MRKGGTGESGKSERGRRKAEGGMAEGGMTEGGMTEGGMTEGGNEKKKAPRDGLQNENSPALQRWDFRDRNGPSPGRDERTVLSSLPGLAIRMNTDTQC